MFKVQNALIAATAEFKRQIALRQNKWTIDEGIELFDEFPGFGIVRNLLINKASKGPDVPAELFVAEFGDFAAGFSL